MNLDLTAIRTMEPMITERLRRVFPKKDFTLERVPAVLTLTEFRRIARMTPFVGLAWIGADVDPNSGRRVQANAKWRAVLVIKASSSLEARFKGDSRGIGLDAMVDVAMAVLQGVTFDGVGLSKVTSAQAIYAEGWEDGDTVIAQVDFQIAYQTSVGDLQLITPDDFSGFEVSWFNSESPDGDDQEPFVQTTNPGE